MKLGILLNSLRVRLSKCSRIFFNLKEINDALLCEDTEKEEVVRGGAYKERKSQPPPKTLHTIIMLITDNFQNSLSSSSIKIGPRKSVIDYTVFRC